MDLSKLGLYYAVVPGNCIDEHKVLNICSSAPAVPVGHLGVCAHKSVTCQQSTTRRSWQIVQLSTSLPPTTTLHTLGCIFNVCFRFTACTTGSSPFSGSQILELDLGTSSTRAVFPIPRRCEVSLSCHSFSNKSASLLPQPTSVIYYQLFRYHWATNSGTHTLFLFSTSLLNLGTDHSYCPCYRSAASVIQIPLMRFAIPTAA